MPQNANRRASARDLTLYYVIRWSEEEARAYIESVVWPPGKQVCPRCGEVNSHYSRPRRGQYVCKAKGCGHTFSVTSRSALKDRKLTLHKILAAILRFTSAHEGCAADQMKMDIDSQHKTAYVLEHKIRDALTRTQSTEKLTGLVHVDGKHMSGRPRKGRKMKTNRPPAVPNKRSYQHRSKLPKRAYLHHPNRRIALAATQVGPPGTGGFRTTMDVARFESAPQCEMLAEKRIDPSATVYSDECPGYRGYKYLVAEHRTVNHSIEYCTDDGINQNQAESVFSRVERQEHVHHRITPEYMIDYLQETAFRIDNRRDTQEQFVRKIILALFHAGPSPDWRGYWQGNHRREEKMLDPYWPRNSAVTDHSKASGP